MRRPIHVLHVIDSLAPGGAERMLVELVNVSGEYNITPSVCVTRSNLTLAEQIHPHISIFALQRKNALDWQGMKLFAQQVKQNTYDILHVHGYGSLRFVTTACILFGLQIPLLLHIHNSEPPNLLTRLTGIRVSHVIATSTETADWAHTYLRLHKNKISLIGNSINQNLYETAIPMDISGWFTFKPLWVGCVVANVLPVKDYVTLFRALAVSKHRNEIGLLVIGSTSDKKYFEHCINFLRDLKLSEQVVFVGSRTDVAQFLKSVDFGLFTSLRETGPLALLEYMAAGIPFISTKVGLVGERLSRTHWAKISLPKDYQNLGASLDTLLEMPKDELDKQRELGRKFTQNEFNMKENMMRLKEVYNLVIGHI